MLRPLIFALGAVCTFSYAGDLSENSLDAGKVSAQSKPVTLLGQGVEVGQKCSAEVLK